MLGFFSVSVRRANRKAQAPSLCGHKYFVRLSRSDCWSSCEACPSAEFATLPACRAQRCFAFDRLTRTSSAWAFHRDLSQPKFKNRGNDESPYPSFLAVESNHKNNTHTAERASQCADSAENISYPTDTSTHFF